MLSLLYLITKRIYTGIWTYAFDEEYEAPNYDFINQFLNIIEPHFIELQNIGINKQDILIWLNYEYDQQCAMEFHPEEMKRLGESGIVMNIDCFQIKHKKKSK